MIRGAALTQGESSELVALPGNTSVSSKPCLTHYYLKQFGARPCIQCTTGQNLTSYRSTMLHSRGVRRRRFADCGGFNAGFTASGSEPSVCSDAAALGMQDGLRGGDPLCKRVLLNVVPSLHHYSFLVREKRFQSPETLLLNYLDVPCCGFDTRPDSALD